MTNLAGTGHLIRLILRRDRALLPLWVGWLGIVAPIAASAFRSLYPTDDLLAVAAKAFSTNPAFRAMFGPVFETNLGSLTAWRASIILVVAAVVSLLTVIRHTRVEEETGRRELVGSTVVGRHAPLAASLIVVTAANLVLGAITAFGLIAQDLPAAGAIGLGLQIALMGIVFAGVGGLAAQFTETAGGARAIALSTLGFTYVIRAAGDAADEVGWLSWLSPMGWTQRIRPFAGEQWWLVGVVLAVGVLVAALAFVLSARRDVGSGMLQPRLGPPVASARLCSPRALAWRLHRGMLLGWSAAFVVLGSIYGSVATAVGDMLRDNPEMRQIFERLGGGSDTIIDLYLAGVAGILALIASGYAIQAALRMRLEEEGQRLEPLLATAVPRARWLAAQVGFALGGPAVALTVGGLAVGVAYGAISGDLAGQVPRVLAATAVQLPAVWLMTAIAVALFGLIPRLSGAAWGVFAVVVFITFIGALLRLGQWFMDLSPFTHIPALPGADLALQPLGVLTGLVVAVVGVGFVGFRQRDIG